MRGLFVSVQTMRHLHPQPLVWMREMQAVTNGRPLAFSQRVTARGAGVLYELRPQRIAGALLHVSTQSPSSYVMRLSNAATGALVGFVNEANCCESLTRARGLRNCIWKGHLDSGGEQVAGSKMGHCGCGSTNLLLLGPCDGHSVPLLLVF